MPCQIVMSLMAAIMLTFTVVQIAYAASMTVMPSGFATCSRIACFASSGYSFMRPSLKLSGFR